MKNYLSLILITFCFWGCSSSDESEEIIEPATLEIIENGIIFSANAESKEFNIKSNSAWKISETPNWLTLSQEKGEGNKTITVKTEENLKEEERSVILKVTAKDKQKILEIRQLPKSVTLALSKTEIIFEAEPSEEGTSFDIISNESWEIFDVPSWCSISDEKGNGNKTIKVVAKKNEDEKKREATIIIKAGSKSETLNIIQKPFDIELAFTDESLAMRETELAINFYEDASSQSVIIWSNTHWKVESSIDWCIPDIIEGEKVQTLLVKVLENQDEAERKGEILISAGSKIIKISISQNGFEIDNPYKLTIKDNMPRSGDELIKKQVKYVNSGNEGENISWNFENLEVIDDQYIVTYDTPPFETNGGYYIMGREHFNVSENPANSLIVCTEHNTMYYYQLKNNILQSIGHENPVTLLHYNPRMILGMLPMRYNDYKKENYESEYIYSGTVSGYTKGYAEVKADGYGTIKLPDGSYENVLRVKWTQIIEETTSESEYTIYKWYVKGYRYPVLETHRTVNTIDNTETFATAFYYPPTDHTYKENKQKTMLRRNNNVKVKSLKKESKVESILPILLLNTR